MSDASLINKEIVERRQQKAPDLQKTLDWCDSSLNAIQAIKDYESLLVSTGSEYAIPVFKDLSEYAAKISILRNQIAIKYDKFRSGCITVTVAGLEKAGKTTFVQKLTEIKELETFSKRCTAANCEIIYQASGEPFFEVAFFSEREYIEKVVSPMVEDIRESQKIDPASLPCPKNLDDIRQLNLGVVKEGCGDDLVLNKLKSIKFNTVEVRKHVGQPLLTKRCSGDEGKWSKDLKEWTSYSQNNVTPENDSYYARVSCVKTLKIHIHYAGGNDFIRIMDTPGVDDPNPISQRLTLEAINRQADILLIMSRPDTNVDPTVSTKNFIKALNNDNDVIALKDRLLWLINVDPLKKDPNDIQPKGEAHKEALMQIGIKQRECFIGPMDIVNNPDAPRYTMERINAHLRDNLSRQDDETIREFIKSIKNIGADIIRLCQKLEKLPVADNDQNALAVYDRWFDYFHQKLMQNLNQLVENPAIPDLRKDLMKIVASARADLQSRLPTNEALAKWQRENVGVDAVMPHMLALSNDVAALVDNISNQVQKVGPVFHSGLVKMFDDSGLGILMEGTSSKERLESMRSKFENIPNTDDLMRVINEALSIEDNIKYVLRFEFRPAINYTEPLCWVDKAMCEKTERELESMIMFHKNSTQAYCEEVVQFILDGKVGNDLTKLCARGAKSVITAAGVPLVNSPTLGGVAPLSHATEKGGDGRRTLGVVLNAAFAGITAVLESGHRSPQRIVDDFVRDIRVKLTTDVSLNPEELGVKARMRNCLFSFKHLLVPELQKLKEQSDQYKKLTTAIESLRKAEQFV